MSFTGIGVDQLFGLTPSLRSFRVRTTIETRTNSAAQGLHSRFPTSTLRTTRCIAQKARPLKIDLSGSPQKRIHSNTPSDVHALLHMDAIFALFCARCIDNPICEKEHVKSLENSNDLIMDFLRCAIAFDSDSRFFKRQTEQAHLAIKARRAYAMRGNGRGPM